METIDDSLNQINETLLDYRYKQFEGGVFSK